MKRKDAEQKRDKAIKQLRELGMSDAEIAAELGMESIVPEQETEIIDVEVVSEEVDPSTDQPVDSGSEPLTHLPAVISQTKHSDNQQDSPTYKQWSEEWWQHAKPEVRQRRCKAHKKTGEQCLKAAINGATVCRYHGGAAKHVKMAARARLENATDLMAKQLLGMAIDPNVADAVKLSAIKDALDRGGLKAPNEVVLSPGQQSGFDDVFDSIVYGAPVEPEPVETHENSTRFFNAPNTAPVDADEYASSGVGYEPERDFDPPAPPPEREHRERRQPQRENQQSGSAAITGLDAMRLANEVRALPPGRDDW